METPVYLDNNATTAVDPAVVSAMLPFFTENYGNPASAHAAGGIAARRVEWAREQVAALLGAAMTSEIVFTSGGTESDATALLAGLAAAEGRTTIVTSTVEHPAISAMCNQLAVDGIATIRRIGVDHHGRLDRQAYRAALDDSVALVSLMWANNETGVIFPIPELASEAKAVGALFHTDAVQAAGKVPMRLADTTIDLLSLSGHKLHGPKGVGALYVRRGVRLRPLLRGGHQERNRRAGTLNVPGIVGLGAAAELATRSMSIETEAIRALRDRLALGITNAGLNATVTGEEAPRLANTLNVVFDGIEGEAVVALLDRRGIAVSAGSACAAGGSEPSPVLRAMGHAPEAAAGAVRFSLSRFTTAAEIDRTLVALEEVISDLRGPSVRARACA